MAAKGCALSTSAECTALEQTLDAAKTAQETLLLSGVASTTAPKCSGECLDTNTYACSASTQTGLCSGSNAVRCCPSGGRKSPTSGACSDGMPKRGRRFIVFTALVAVTVALSRSLC